MKRALRVIAGFLPTVLRVLFGLLLISSGWTWLHRPDPAAYLASAVEPALETGRPFGFYEPFLRAVVAPHLGVFAGLVGWGELLSGVSLTLGLATRLGAAVIAFQFLNYGLLGGPSSLLAHAIMIAIGPSSGSSAATMQLVIDAIAWIERSMLPSMITSVAPEAMRNSVMVSAVTASRLAGRTKPGS